MSVLYSFNPMKHSDGNLRTNPEMESIQHLNSGLLRYHSAPSSFLKDLLNEEASKSIGHHQHHHNHPSSSSEMEAMLGKLVSSSNNGWMKQEEEAKDSVSEGYNGYNPNSYGSQVIYQKSQQVQNLPNDGSFNATKSTLGPNNLLRQKSSPAGLLENAWRDVGSFRGCDVSNGTNLAFSSRPSSSSCTRQLPQIAENGNETLVEEATCVQSRNLRNDNGSYVPSFTSEFWDGSSSFNDSKSGSDNDEIMFSTSDGFETQNAGFDYQNLGLTHHMSLPSSSTKLSAIDKFLQVQPYVPCKIRAKRGFATHPRSIAERVRRTRISERIKKLQELFPKSDKQTSTADMLDLAVDYIKGLQKQVKILTDTRAKCRCSSN